MDLANATDITRWADEREAQSLLPKLVRRLIGTTAKGLVKLSMRAGEGVGIPGWDGIVITQSADAHVSEGVSVWEMGVNSDPAAKANREYRKRTDKTGEITPGESIFVFVTPRRWRDKDAWAERRRRENVWNNIVVYDADDLETWLERAPGVHAWFSAIIGKDPYEAESLETWWESWSGVTQPVLPPSLLLSGREKTAEQIYETISGEPKALSLSGDSQEEVVAFFAATLIERASATDLARSLIVRTPNAWRRMAVTEQPLILLPLYPNPDITMAIRHGHHVLVPLGREAAVSNDMVLPRLRRFGIENALKEAGLPGDRASDLATLGRRSLLSLRRTLAVTPEIQTPEWARPEHAREIFPAVLAGKWQVNSEGDRAAIAELAGRPYEEVATTLTRWVHTSDPPVRYGGNVWYITAKQDAWRLTARFLTDDDFQRFRKVVQDVIGGDDPSLDLPPEKRFMSSILGKQRAHSGHLILGLADTLALMATLSDQVPLTDGRIGQNEANFIVRQLLEAANEDTTGRHWIVLSEALPLLAEASPEVFLNAVETGLSGDDPVILKLFQDNEDHGIMYTSSAHTGLLWGLENLAWSTDYLARAALILAKLTRLDLGGRLLNRPGASLRDVLLLWRPGTSASLEQRVQIVDLIRKHEPEVAWSLTLQLIPSSRESASSTHTPRWRDWKQEEKRVLYSDLDRSVKGLVTRALEDVGNSGRRWSELLECIPNLSSELRMKVISELEKLQRGEFSDEDRAVFVKNLRNFTGRHREYHDDEGSIPQEEIDRIEEMISQLAPDNPFARHAWLFDQGAVYAISKKDYDKQIEAVSEAQKEALNEILDVAEIEAVFSWPEEFKSPWFTARQIGSALSDAGLKRDAEARLFEELSSEVKSRHQVAATYISGIARQKGTEMMEWVEGVLSDRADTWSPKHKAAFLYALPVSSKVWHLAENCGKETEREYWENASHNGLPLECEDCIVAVRKLMEYGNPFSAIILLDYYAEKSDPPVELIVDVMEQAVRTTPPQYLDQMFSYHVGRLLDRLEEARLDESRLAALEWAYLPLFRFEKSRARTLHNRLATDPEFFVEIVSLVYKAKGGEPRELSDEEQARARTARDLLDSWRVVPGTQADGSINPQSLSEWVDEARKLLQESGRLSIGDLHIGKILRYGPTPQNDNWPAESICDLIENVESESLEEGFSTEVFNSRGTTVRSPIEGGQQERELANQYLRYAASLGIKYTRTAAMLNRIAAWYEEDARRNDQDADLTEDFWR